ncbi:MAG: DUF1287 domain-containing protein [Parvularculaceae bacterium]|nr:DUF1287 domain-containing protein [Parvularculaceae bacterium]
MRRRQVLQALAALPVIGAASPAPAQARNVGGEIAAAALAQTRTRVVYDPAYVVLAYPGGDVPADRGVCADVIIRALRKVGADLQVLVHEDMKANFAAYPKRWGLKKPDRNIDHRRVPNLETFFTREGLRRALTTAPANFRPGDVVSWNLKGDSGSLPHIGIVTARKARSGRPMVVHNIGAGVQHEDVLFQWKMTGHFRIAPKVEEWDRES